jgi:putative hydrolase of HD superfamily
MLPNNGIIPFDEKVKTILEEYKERETKEAKIAKDADNIEWILSLKEQVDTGNTRAKTWIPSAVKRLITNEAKQLAKVITETDSDSWWFSDKDGDWWVNRSKQ